MKLITKIFKSSDGWVWVCEDGSTIRLSTWLTDRDIKAAYCWHKRSPANIRKVIKWNKYIAFGHSLWVYKVDNNTKVTW